MSLGQKHPGIHSIPVFSRQSVWLHSVDSAVSTTRFSLWPGKWPAAVEHGTGDGEETNGYCGLHLEASGSTV